ncbi:MAG: (2Fe-2S) ferredoxin domain-containing protein [Rhodospirillales bacterium]|nr:(2Fe-2S) ferredoxin domain-containing protein [Rhodospirillales bacterium]
MTSDEGDPPPFYRLHVFCCTNERPEGHERGSCARRGSVRLRDYMKARTKELGLDDVRINSAGCLDRCELGPTVVIYPDGVWYRCETRADVDEVLLRHVLDGERIPRLMLWPDSKA